MAKVLTERNRWRGWCQSGVGAALVALVGCHGAQTRDDSSAERLDPSVRTTLVAPPGSANTMPGIPTASAQATNRLPGSMDYRNSFNRALPTNPPTDAVANSGVQQSTFIVPAYQQAASASGAGAGNTQLAQQPTGREVEQASASMLDPTSNSSRPKAPSSISVQPPAELPIRKNEVASSSQVSTSTTALPLANPIPPELPGMSFGWGPPLDGAGWQGSSGNLPQIPPAHLQPVNMTPEAAGEIKQASSAKSVPQVPGLPLVPSATDVSHPLPLPQLPEPVVEPIGRP